MLSLITNPFQNHITKMQILTSSTIGSALAILLSLFLHVSSQSEDCQEVIVGLAPCLQYIQGNATTPSSGCCTQLATIVKTRPRCVCHVFSGVNVNQTLAMALPKACNVQTPSLTLCKGQLVNEHYSCHHACLPIQSHFLLTHNFLFLSCQLLFHLVLQVPIQIIRTKTLLYNYFKKIYNLLLFLGRWI